MVRGDRRVGMCICSYTMKYVCTLQRATKFDDGDATAAAAAAA